MKVRCGLMTATEAAYLLGVSRKTYYKWEQRGLVALLEGLQEQTGGRPEIPRQQRRESEAEKQLAQLQRENELLQKRMQLRDLAHQMQLQAEKDGAKKK
jgi:predicted site-specific integrase-resolvase